MKLKPKSVIVSDSLLWLRITGEVYTFAASTPVSTPIWGGVDTPFT